MRICVNDIYLNVERSGTGPPLLLLHGFTGSSETWVPFLATLEHEYTTIAVDLIGHGRSAAPSDPRRYTLSRCVDDLCALLDYLGIACTAVLGYSLGGRASLQLALAASHRVGALILESTSAGVATASERAERVRSDEALAQYLEEQGIVAFVDYWERHPLFASQQRLPAEVRASLHAQRLRNSAQGLANSLRGMGAGAQEPLWARLHELTIPILLIAGLDDPKYTDLAFSMQAALPKAEIAIVPEAGHTVHLEQPNRFIKIVLDFLRRNWSLEGSNTYAHQLAAQT
jgi:2-succinyl-6-hydroxy-2,4-cyclohexadiene-1-carboxylate synthase